MGPVEVVFFTIGAMIALIALARGYKQEIGSTLIILVAILVLSFFEEEILGVSSLWAMPAAPWPFRETKRHRHKEPC
jgi:uncharacterized membrane protein required for colicin V production